MRWKRVSYILRSSLAFVNTGGRRENVNCVVEAVFVNTGRKDTIALNAVGKGIIYPTFISSICEHRRQKAGCKECNGSSICEHGRQNATCKECGGSSLCEHGKIKARCRECGGSAICVHDKDKYSCAQCKRIKR
jgi:hypothetical protein